MDRTEKLFGITALFDDPDSIIGAAKKVVNEGYKKFDVNTPYPLHGMDPAMGLKRSKLGFVTLFFGFSGTAFILLFMYWTMSVDYPMVIGGKPYFALPAFIPITFEFTVLLAALSTVFGMIMAFFNLPYNNHPLHDTEYMKRVSVDRYGLVILAEDVLFDENKVQELFKSLGAKEIEKVYWPEKVSYPVFDAKFITFLIIVAVAISGITYFTLNKFMYMVPYNWMSEQDKVIPQEKSDFFADGFGMREPVEGTVARGFVPYPYMGIAEPKEYLVNPVLPTKESIDLGKRKFLTFCSPCHGNYADGDSRLRGQFPKPPSLHTERAISFPDGRIYHVITNGQNAMPSYADQISREERWSIVNYIRVLQRAKNATDADIQEIKKESSSNVQK
jgi:mono/diheme cytochrome c family protein